MQLLTNLSHQFAVPNLPRQCQEPCSYGKKKKSCNLQPSFFSILSSAGVLNRQMRNKSTSGLKYETVVTSYCTGCPMNSDHIIRKVLEKSIQAIRVLFSHQKKTLKGLLL